MYLFGRTRYKVQEYELQRLMGRWFYAVTLTGRYVGAFETTMEADLNRVANLPGPQAFVEVLDRIVRSTLTHDFWTITLPGMLETSSARTPALLAYYASQNKLDAPVLFSDDKRIRDLLDPTIKTKKKSLDRHHLFPRAWLERQGITDLKLINQTANFAFLEWPDNIDISDDAPCEYLPTMRYRFKDRPVDWRRMVALHALPEGWEKLRYEEFLAQRRVLMAEIIRRGYETLT
jgi:hypothetical protein